ncbi:peptidylprolyl isomerase [Opitutus sp. ER46]|uniref:peptidylprolyl isomerase n=1 Tax=Opitutus sp. ER46 TaxID=2161864 RepID=UPI001E52F960|nr:peptidylprolyl isomerase [Opitutus sp. ER46]
MTLRRLASFVFAAATSAAVYAQTPHSTPAAGAEGQITAPNTMESLNLRFANGIVAVAEEKIITVADVMREIIPLQQQIRNEARSQKEYDEKMEQLEDSVIQELIDRVLIIKEFHKDEKRQIPVSYVDNAISDRIAEQFDNDRAKFLAYLRAQGKTVREYRRDVEEEIIYGYMRGQQRKSETIISPVRIETYYNENKDKFYQEDQVHLRLIQLTRNEGETDEKLRQQANLVLARFNGGEKFEDLAKEYSRDARRSKGGDWGWLKRSDFRQEFSERAFNLKKGEASEPVLLPEGCFILFAEDRKFAGIQPIDDVRDQIERILVTQLSHTSQERWLERLRRNGYVKHY